MRSRHYVLGTILTALLVGCGGNHTPAPTMAAPPPDPNAIIIDNFTFNPSTLTVAAGTTITWINRDDVPHTVTSSNEPRTLNSGVLDTGGVYRFTFTTAGSYPYYCTVHPHMTATILVK